MILLCSCAPSKGFVHTRRCVGWESCRNYMATDVWDVGHFRSSNYSLNNLASTSALTWGWQNKDIRWTHEEFDPVVIDSQVTNLHRSHQWEWQMCTFNTIYQLNLTFAHIWKWPLPQHRSRYILCLYLYSLTCTAISATSCTHLGCSPLHWHLPSWGHIILCFICQLFWQTKVSNLTVSTKAKLEQLMHLLNYSL